MPAAPRLIPPPLVRRTRPPTAPAWPTATHPWSTSARPGAVVIPAQPAIRGAARVAARPRPVPPPAAVAATRHRVPHRTLAMAATAALARLRPVAAHLPEATIVPATAATAATAALAGPAAPLVVPAVLAVSVV